VISIRILWVISAIMVCWVVAQAVLRQRLGSVDGSGDQTPRGLLLLLAALFALVAIWAGVLFVAGKL
jgi:cytosine/uracil/thiamine/allantoin permease